MVLSASASACGAMAEAQKQKSLFRFLSASTFPIFRNLVGENVSVSVHACPAAKGYAYSEIQESAVALTLK